MHEDLNYYLNNLNIRKDEFTSQEKVVLGKILSEYERTGKSKLLDSLYLEDYEEKPVSITRFIEDPDYLGKATQNGEAIWPFWKQTLKEIFSPQAAYTRCLFGGAIGIGKSSIACFGLNYILYKLLCLKDPTQYYGPILPGSKPGIALFNITLTKGFGVAYSKIMYACLNSPWMMRHGQTSGSGRNEIYLPDKNIEIGVGSGAEHFVGLDSFGAFLDELNDKERKTLKLEQMKAYDALLAIQRRIESRFMDLGQIPGIVFLVSSAKTEDDFMSQMKEQCKEDPHTYLVEKPFFEIAPPERYRGDKFPVAIGTKSADQYLITQDEVEDYEKRGFKIYMVPAEHKRAFEVGINDAIRDILGLTLKTAGKFIDNDRIDERVDERFKNCLSTSDIKLGLHDSTNLLDYLQLRNINTKLIRYPLFVHHDLSLSGDGTGIYINAVSHDASYLDLKEEEIMSWRFIPVLWGRIKPSRKGDQIPLSNLRRSIIRLRDEYGFNIIGVSADGYQSAEMLQNYSISGFWTKLISMDRAPSTPYQFARTCIYDGRVIIPKDEILNRELKQLVENRAAEKIDHPSGGCFTGDTKIKLLGGNHLSFLDIVQSGVKEFGVYSVNRDGKIVHGRARNCRITKWVNSICVLTLDNGNVIRCTPDHPFMLNNSNYKMAIDLKPEDTLMPRFGLVRMETIKLDIPIPVYDIEVDTHHNFLLSAGVFVHNSKDIADAFTGSMYCAVEYNKGRRIFESGAYLYSDILNSMARIENETQKKKQEETSDLDIIKRAKQELFSGVDRSPGIFDYQDFTLL